MNIERHFDARPVTVNSQPIRLYINFMTLLPNLTLTELQDVSMEQLLWTWHGSRERLPFRTPGSVPIWDMHVFLFLKLAMIFPIFHF